eukprot:gene14070-5056_t
MACDNSQNPRLEEKDLNFMTAGVMLFLGRSYRGSKVYAEYEPMAVAICTDVKRYFVFIFCSQHSLRARSLLKSLLKMADRWYFTREQIRNSPSVREGGIDCAKELGYRQQCANFVQDIGQRLAVYVHFPSSTTRRLISYAH